jgi:hypothetical protein
MAGYALAIASTLGKSTACKRRNTMSSWKARLDTVPFFIRLFRRIYRRARNVNSFSRQRTLAGTSSSTLASRKNFAASSGGVGLM